MERRKFITKGIVAGAVLPAAYAMMSPEALASEGGINENAGGSIPPENDPVVIERSVSGKPHKGKVLAVIQPHCDDIALFAAGTVAKLVDEGYTAYMIRTSNDDVAGLGRTLGERVVNNEIDTEATAKVMGITKVYNLNYRNHRMDEYNIQEIKGRLIFLFRLLKVDTILCYDPWGHYEENPDHYVTAKAVEAARWMAGSLDYPEHFDVVKPHLVQERYYFARGPQMVNRVVDIGKYIDKKVESNVVIKTQGPGGDAGAHLRKSLAEQGKTLPILGDNDDTANASFVKNFVLDIDSEFHRAVPSDKEVARKYGLEWAEQFHYFAKPESKIGDFVNKNAVKK
ncbi:MAG: PIG-L family deacetylase [Bacteroidota bacterium]